MTDDRQNGETPSEPTLKDVLLNPSLANGLKVNPVMTEAVGQLSASVARLQKFVPPPSVGDSLPEQMIPVSPQVEILRASRETVTALTTLVDQAEHGERRDRTMLTLTKWVVALTAITVLASVVAAVAAIVAAQ